MSTSKTRPATDKQLATIERLFPKAVRNDDDQWTYAERAAIALGYVDADGFADLDNYRVGSPLSSREASAQITVLSIMAKEPRCAGYCAARGVKHRHVHYYDGHYDYECGLS